MLELLAIPAWNTPATTLDQWVAEFELRNVKAVVARESPGIFWLEAPSLRLRGYALSEGIRLEAINFELSDPIPSAASELLEATCAALGWELHEDTAEDDEKN
jgi:hypothetical protein